MVPAVLSSELLDCLNRVKAGLALRAFVGYIAPFQDALSTRRSETHKADGGKKNC